MQVATACSAGSRQATCRAQQARSTLAAVRESAGLAEAKADALAAELARLARHRCGGMADADGLLFKVANKGPLAPRPKATPWAC